MKTGKSGIPRKIIRLQPLVISTLAAVLGLWVLSGTPVQAVVNADYTALPPFTSTEVKPNVLFILDNSNSMDEDVDGAAVGGRSALSRSEIARKAILQIVRDQKDNMRFGLLAYRQSDVSRRYIHNSFYYNSYGSSTYDVNATPSPKDPTENGKRYPNPSDPGEFIYYDTALPYYSASSSGNGYCYARNYREGGRNDSYWCYHTKTGDKVTPPGKSRYQLESKYGYRNYFNTYKFNATDSDIAAGFSQFGYEMSWVPVGPTWFAGSSPGDGILHVNIDDSSDSHIAEMEAKLATSQFHTKKDTPLRNAGFTPIAGTIDSAKNFFKGIRIHTARGVVETNPITLECQNNYVILVTDGLPSVNKYGKTGNADSLLAELKASITSLRSTKNTNFSKPFDVQTYVIGFALPPELGSKLDDLAVAGGTDIDGKALLANSAIELGQKLKILFRDISKKVASGASASVVSSSSSGEGVTYQSVFYPEYTDDFSPSNQVKWVGNISSLFVDSFGNLREDTDGDKQFDIEDDYFVVYRNNGSGVVVRRYKDSNKNNLLDLNEDLNGNGFLDHDLNEDKNRNGVLDGGEDLNGNNLLDISVDEDRNGNGLLDVDEDANNNGELDPGEDLNGDYKLYEEDEVIDEVNISDLGYLWEANDWLNEITDADIVTQRTYASVGGRRYIFTFVDSDGDKVVGDGEQVTFTEDKSAILADHLLVYPTLTDEPAWLSAIRRDGNYEDFFDNQAKRIINFIRGKDQATYVSSTSPSYTLGAMRSRQADYDDDGNIETWRLGDIIHSGPLAVGRASESFHLLYDDESYADFADKYLKRRNVIYVGGNDGMVHAFNAGFYDSDNKKVNKYSITRAEPYLDENNDGSWNSGEEYTDRNYNSKYDDGIGEEAQHELGSELWAYIPYNLLPHLRWLTSVDYEHVYYNDLSPRVFDAKIFTEEAACSSDIKSAACIHPHGWGTVLVTGMRFGGGHYAEKKSYDFSSGSMGWSFAPAAKVRQSFVDGTWVIEAKRGVGNPKLISPANIDIDASVVKNVEIRFLTTAIDSGSGGTRLYWDTVGNEGREKWNEGSVAIGAPSVDVSGNFYTYTFDMSGDSRWDGTIKRLRLDPQGAFTKLSIAEIDYIDIGDGRGYSSSYTVIDVTNPEIAPTVLAELNPPGLGFTTSMPTVVPIKSKDDTSKNDWYLVFGSGPNNNQIADTVALTTATSNTTGKLYVASLKDIAQEHELKMLDSDGELSSGEHVFAEFDSDTIISAMITVDLDLDFDADVVYFGTTSGNERDGWGGKMRRILFNDGDQDTTTWIGDSTLFELPHGQSITAAASIGMDNKKNFWIYFGGGRYFVRDDVSILNSQNYYGIKEPRRANNYLTKVSVDDLTWGTVTKDELLDTSDANVFDDKKITGMGDLDNWYKLIHEIDMNRSGWMIDLDTLGERNLGQAALLGGLVTFTTYTPYADLCSMDGVSDGYGLYYKTGTSYYKSIFGFTHDDQNGNKKIDEGEKVIDKKFRIGRGVTFSPAIHTGGDDGSSAIFQSSDGSITTVEEANPGFTKSQKTGWKNMTQ
ncbi:MAG: hypothetical protein COA36_04835 [Desulfotalea sp.]|nr:MAG: hypothetical protein COA36_04835 [Desulfotalea sp.]